MRGHIYNILWSRVTSGYTVAKVKGSISRILFRSVQSLASMSGYIAAKAEVVYQGSVSRYMITKPDGSRISLIVHSDKG